MTEVGSKISSEELECFDIDDWEGDIEGEGGFVAFSGGKDSTAMLLRMLEMIYNNEPGAENYPVDRIAFADTRFEFPELYAYIKRINEYIQEKFPGAPEIELLDPSKDWDAWFYGKITRGRNKGKVRGAPLKVYPCWWSRDAKVIPLKRAQKGYRWCYIGYGYDEQHRVQVRSSETTMNRYPLIEWKWTEADCMAYLDHLGLGNSLYLSFNRIGCFHCPKQPLYSWYEVWRDWPHLFDKAVHWDQESRKVSGHGLRDDMTLPEMKDRFEDGFIPTRRKKLYECNTCDAVANFTSGDLKLEDFDDDDAIERDDNFQGSSLQLKMFEEVGTVEWIPPSHLKEQVEWL
jgi:3'-phosphoadenosine 5'-phosphosulfate sulfotransferase (PAPS reductase)/FAD synthetase